MNQKYIDMIYSDVHLEHHGVLGQKWGVENGPPYPLGRDVQSMLSNGASYHSIKKAIKSDYKAEKKELKNTVVNEEKHYMNTLNDERRKNEEAWNKFLNDDPRRIAEDYQYNKKVDGRIARDLRKDQRKDLQSRKEAEENRYASAIDNATKRNDEAWDKYADSKKAAKENYKSEMKELNDATRKERLNKALKIAGVAAGAAAIYGVGYLVAKKATESVYDKLDREDRRDNISDRPSKFNRATIAEKIAKDKTLAKEGHGAIRDGHLADRRVTDAVFGNGNIEPHMNKSINAFNKATSSITELHNSKSKRDRAAADLLRKYELNGYAAQKDYHDVKKYEYESSKDRAQVNRASVDRAQVGRASVDRDTKNKKSKR